MQPSATQALVDHRLSRRSSSFVPNVAPASIRIREPGTNIAASGLRANASATRQWIMASRDLLLPQAGQGMPSRASNQQAGATRDTPQTVRENASHTAKASAIRPGSGRLLSLWECT